MIASLHSTLIIHVTPCIVHSATAFPGEEREWEPACSPGRLPDAAAVAFCTEASRSRILSWPALQLDIFLTMIF